MVAARRFQPPAADTRPRESLLDRPEIEVASRVARQFDGGVLIEPGRRQLLERSGCVAPRTARRPATHIAVGMSCYCNVGSRRWRDGAAARWAAFGSR